MPTPNQITNHQGPPLPNQPRQLGTMLRQELQGAMKWVVLGAVSLVALAIILFLLRPSTKEFTLIVRNASPGTTVLVDEVAMGIPDETGTIKVSHLKIGEHKVTLSSEGTQTIITGGNGDVKEITATLRLPKEIIYGGVSMVLVGAGEFLMGDDSIANAKPARTVAVEDFYIDKYEVSNELYEKLCGNASNQRPCPATAFEPSYFATKKKFPVLGIDYADAEAFAQSVGKRLPTEAEWEKAASWDPIKREKRKWAWGNNENQPNINVGTPDFVPVDAPTGDISFYGAYNMTGNAREWVDGLYSPYPGNQASDPMFNRNFRVMRGGENISKLQDISMAMRLSDPRSTGTPNKNNWAVSFRCAISASDPKISHLLKKNN